MGPTVQKVPVAVAGDRPVSASAPTLPSIDVVIPAFNEARHIGRCLDHTLSQDYPPDRYRVLLVDAGSDDGTAAVAARHAAEGRLEVIDAERRLTTPEALNLGIAEATADLVARVDAHGYPEPDFLRRGAEALRRGGAEVACVGGRPLEIEGSAFEHAFTLARGSSFGVGGSVYAATDRREVDTVPWGTYRREALLETGGFDPLMNHGEDEELNWRLRQLGYRIVFDPAIRFRYVPRSTWGGVFRQYRDYGKARVRVVSAHPGFLRPRHLAPAALVAGGVALLACSAVSVRGRRALARAGAGYACAAVGAALSATRGEDRRLAPSVAACFVALHAGYGVGTLDGLARRLLAPAGSDRPSPVLFGRS